MAVEWFGRSHIYRHDCAQVTLVVSTDYLVCGWLEYSSCKKAFVLRGYQKTSLNGQIQSQNFFNPTFIGMTIATFLEKHSLKNSSISCAFVNPLITERLTIKAQATPSITAFVMEQTHHTLWDYLYLYPTDTDEHVFYVCSVLQSFLLQYKLMALTYDFSLCFTTSQSVALLQLYRFMYAEAFRASQLGIDLQRCHGVLERLFNNDTLSRILVIPSSFNIALLQERGLLATMCGLGIAASCYKIE